MKFLKEFEDKIISGQKIYTIRNSLYSIDELIKLSNGSMVSILSVRKLLVSKRDGKYYLKVPCKNDSEEYVITPFKGISYYINGIHYKCLGFDSYVDAVSFYDDYIKFGYVYFYELCFVGMRY